MIGHAPVVFVLTVVGFWFVFSLLAALAGALDFDGGKEGCIIISVLTTIAIVLLIGSIFFGLFLG